MSEEKQIPKGWKSVALGEILSVSSGKGLKINELQGGKYAVYGGNGINGYYSEYLIEEPKLIIGRVGVKCGVTYITRPKSWVTDNALIVTPKVDDFDINYFKLKLEFENLNKLSVSTAQPVISGSKIYAYEINYPPLNQQRQIVTKLEELFSKLDNGVESLKTLQQQLKVYRQSVLKWAFEGRLTNANVKDGELPKGWIRADLGNYIDTIGAGKSFKCEERPPRSSEIGVLKVSAVTWGEFDEEESKTVIDGTMVNKNYFVKEGDFLFSRANTIELVGACVLVKQIKKQLMLSDKTLRITFKNSLNKMYALHFLKSFTGKKQIQILSTGNQESMRNIGQAKIKQIEIVLPESTTLQSKVVQEIESRLSVCDKIEETIANGIKEAEALRQSILKQAFEGKLV